MHSMDISRRHRKESCHKAAAQQPLEHKHDKSNFGVSARSICYCSHCVIRDTVKQVLFSGQLLLHNSIV